MKKIAGEIAFIFVLAMFLTSFTSCLSLSSLAKMTLKPVKYSFAKNENEAASITFYKNEGLYSDEEVFFLDFEGATLPKPETGTRWEDTIIFPAGVPLKIKVHAVRDRDASEIDLFADLGDRSKKVVFECPPLEAGKEYQLKYNYRAFISDQLILTNKITRKTIYIQEFN